MLPEPHTVESYRKAVLSLVSALGVENVDLAAALGRITAEPVLAGLPVPCFDNSAMDGYAVRASDIADTAPDRPVTLVRLPPARAGSPRPAALREGEARPVMTGAPLPPGADRVVPVECTTGGAFDDEPVVSLWDPGRSNIRRRGEDIAERSTIVPSGVELGPRDLALIAATGHARVLVRRRPRVAVVSTGDELLARKGPTGGVPDANSVYLRAAIVAVGGEVSSVRIARDDEHAQRLALDAAAREADLIVSTGGVGPGTHDIAGRLAAASPDGVLARVAMRPGRPQAHARWNGTPWLALPGNPTAAFVSFETFVRPVLERLVGAEGDRSAVAETVSVGWSGTPGSVRFVPLTVGGDGDSLTVGPLGPPGRAAHSLSTMFRAPLIAMVSAETADVRAGQLVPVIEPA